MESPRSVNSPRRTLSLSRKRRATVSFLDFDDKNNSTSGLSADHGPKPSEVYGFVGSIITVVATGFFFPYPLFYQLFCLIESENYNCKYFILFLFSLSILNRSCNAGNQNTKKMLKLSMK